MRRYLGKLRDKTKIFVNRKARGFLDRYLDFGVLVEGMLDEDYLEDDLQNIPEDEDDQYESEIDLEPLHQFMSDYIGMIIIGVKGFSDDTILKEAEKIQCKTVTDCKMDKDSIIFELSNMSGKISGSLRLSPSKHGSFAEREPGDIPLYSSRYRIFFYGGDTLEYLDTEKSGSIEYIGSQL